MLQSHGSAVIQARRRWSYGRIVAALTLCCAGAAASTVQAQDIQTVERFASYLIRLLEAMVAGEEQTVSRLAMLSDAEREGLLARANRTFDVPPAREAVHHLFTVTSGLDSAVLGDTEILGQVKTAWEKAALEQSTGPVLNLLFRHALETGKRAASRRLKK